MTDLTAATAALVAATGQLVGTKAELLDWSVGTVTGGPDGNGDYPFTAADGTIIKVPCPSKIAAMNGDPTSAAATLQAVAGAAVAAAASSSGSATTATQQAGVATGAATTATTEAGIATAQAGTAAGAASTATGAATTATGAAATATTQAGVATSGAQTATTKAGVATGAATTATTQAAAAAGSATAAGASANGASSSAAATGAIAATITRPVVQGTSIDGDEHYSFDRYGRGEALQFVPAGLPLPPIGSVFTIAGQSIDGDDVYDFDRYGRGEAISPTNVAGQSIDGDDVYTFDRYGRGVALGAAAAPVVTTDYISPADYNPDYRGTWYSVVQGMLYRGGSGAIAIISGSQFEVDGGGCGLPFAQRVTKALGDGGPGWVPILKNSNFNTDSCVSANQQARWTVSGSWTGSYLTVADSPDICSGTTSTAGDTATLAFTGTGTITTAELHHLGGGGAFTYAYNGGAAVSVTLPAAPGKLALASPPATGHRYWRLKFDSTKRGYCGCATLELRTRAGGPTVATGGTAISDSVGDGAAANAFDTDPTTSWNSGSGGNHWIGYDFGAGNAVGIVEAGFIGRADGNGYLFSDVDSPQTGGIEYSDDGATWTRFFAIGAPASGYKNGAFAVFTSPPPAGAFTCVFTAVSGSLPIAGAVLKKATGCTVHNLADGGAAAYHFAGVDQTKRRAALARLGFDAVLTSLGANDEGAARTTAQFVADMQTNIAAPRAVNTGCAVVVGMQPQTNRVPATGWSPAITPMMAAYTEGMRPLAKPGLFGLYCSQLRFGTVPSQYDYGGTAFIGTGPDYHHFNQTGRDIYVSGGCEMLGV